jgi:hypothetical protein
VEEIEEADQETGDAISADDDRDSYPEPPHKDAPTPWSDIEGRAETEFEDGVGDFDALLQSWFGDGGTRRQIEQHLVNAARRADVGLDRLSNGRDPVGSALIELDEAMDNLRVSNAKVRAARHRELGFEPAKVEAEECVRRLSSALSELRDFCRQPTGVWDLLRDSDEFQTVIALVYEFAAGCRDVILTPETLVIGEDESETSETDYPAAEVMVQASSSFEDSPVADDPAVTRGAGAEDEPLSHQLAQMCEGYLTGLTELREVSRSLLSLVAKERRPLNPLRRKARANFARMASCPSPDAVDALRGPMASLRSRISALVQAMHEQRAPEAFLDFNRDFIAPLRQVATGTEIPSVVARIDEAVSAYDRLRDRTSSPDRHPSLAALHARVDQAKWQIKTARSAAQDLLRELEELFAGT